ncbi:MAG TPA: protein translocase subunit SecF [Sphaerochaeta sp.]|nr:protein translocase subunit SecF [Sphaerochaeta sp.]
MPKKDIPVIRYRWFAWGLAIVLLLVGGGAFILNGGFNLGVDFESGLSQRIQVAPVGLTVSYSGNEDAVLSISASALSLEVRGSEGVSVKTFKSASYPTAADLAAALNAVDKIDSVALNGSMKTADLLSGYGFPATLSSVPTSLNFKASGSVSIEDIREALGSLGNVKVQTMGASDAQMFQIRLGIKDNDTQTSMEEAVRLALAGYFGDGSVVVLASDYMGAKFSKTLLSSSIFAIIVAMALILVYVWFRFKFAYAVSSLIALAHDVLMLLGAIALFRFEFSSTTIAALLTIIGYSLNNTIVIFDRIRENITLNKDASLADQIDKSVTQSLSRTIMSAATTLVAILPLAIFASGDIRMFAVNMSFGILFGTYSSNLLAPALLYWISKAQKKDNTVEKAEKAK